MRTPGVFLFLIVTLLGITLSPARAAQVNEKTILFKGGEEVPGLPDYHSYRIPSVVRAANGNVIAIAEGRVDGAGDSGDIDVIYRVHDGSGWGPIKRMWSKHGNTCGNPTSLLDKETGFIWVMLNYNDGNLAQSDVGEGDRKVYVTWSTDHGQTFALPINISNEVQPRETAWDAVGPGAGIQLERGRHAGRLMFPAIGRHIFSDDNGASWTWGMEVNPGTSESTVLELNDGTLYRNDRAVTTAMKCVFRRPTSMSFDTGLTWTDWNQDNGLLAPGHYNEATGCPLESKGIRRCHASTLRYTAVEPYRVMFANPASSVKRRYMTIRISYDEGETWPISRRLHGGLTGYSSLVKTPDNMTGVLYEQPGEGGRMDVAFHKVNLSWILNGRREPVHPAGNGWLGDYDERSYGWYRSSETGWVFPIVSARADHAYVFFQDVGVYYRAWRSIPNKAYHPGYGWRSLPGG